MTRSRRSIAIRRCLSTVLLFTLVLPIFLLAPSRVQAADIQAADQTDIANYENSFVQFEVPASYANQQVQDRLVPGSTLYPNARGQIQMPSSDSLACDGYRLASWQDKNNSRITYVPGWAYPAQEIFPMSGDPVTLVPVFEAVDTPINIQNDEPISGTTYTISYNANNGDPNSAPAPQVVAENHALTLSGTIPTRTHFSFKGWSTSPNGSPDYQPNSGYVFTSNTTLYAQWAENVYEIQYNANGDNVSNMPQTQTFKVSQGNVKISAISPTRPNHTFLGWSASPNGSVQYLPANSYSFSGDTSLYAIWQAKDPTYNITYNPNANNVSNMPAQQPFRPSQGHVKISTVIPSLNGYTFLGWSPDGKTIYEPGKSYSFSSDIILYAQWKKIDNSSSAAPASSEPVNPTDDPQNIKNSPPEKTERANQNDNVALESPAPHHNSSSSSQNDGINVPLLIIVSILFALAVAVLTIAIIILVRNKA